MEIQFIGGAYSGRSTNLDAQVTQNCYVEVNQQGGKKPLALIGTPGMVLFASTGITGEGRGALIWNDLLHVVVGATLYSITTAGVVTAVGTLGISTGKVWMAGGTTHLCLVDGTDGYYKTAAATSLTTITDVDFPTTPTSITYLDGYFFVTASGTDTWFISGSEDASSWDGLDFASAEDTPDDALAAIKHGAQVWIPGEYTTEIFYDSGDSDFP